MHFLASSRAYLNAGTKFALMQVTPKMNAENVESSEIKSPTWCKHRTNLDGPPNLAANGRLYIPITIISSKFAPN